MVFFLIWLSAAMFTSADWKESFELAKSYKIAGRFSDSAREFEKVINLGSIDPISLLESRLILGDLYWNIGEMPRAQVQYQFVFENSTAFPEIRRTSNLSIKVLSLYENSKKMRLAERYQEAIDEFQKAVVIARELKNYDFLAKLLRQQSASYFNLNNLPEFYRLNMEVLQLAKSTNNLKEHGYSLNNLGLYYWKIDRYSEALSKLNDCLKISEEIQNIEILNDCYNNLGCLYQSMGDFEGAGIFLEKALQLSKLRKNDEGMAFAFINIATNYRKKSISGGNYEDYQNALKYFLLSLDLAKSIKNSFLHLSNLNNLGSLYSDHARFEDAMSYFEQALSIAKEMNDVDNESMILNNMGIVQHNLGAFDRADAFFNQAIALALEKRNSQVLWEAFLELGNSSLKQGDFEKASVDYRRSISIVENIRSGIASEDFRAKYLGSDKRIEPYQNLIHALLGTPGAKPERLAEAFETLEKAKARSFLDSLEASELDLSQGLNPDLAADEKLQMKEISALYTKALMPGLTQEERDGLGEEIRSAEEGLETLKREIRSTSPAYAELKYPSLMRLREVSRTFRDHRTAYLAYSLGKTASYGFALRDGLLSVFALPPRDDLVRTTIAYRRALADRDNKDFSLGEQLFRELVKPGLGKGVDRLVVIPDDVLNLLPFEALVRDDGSRRWLLQDSSVSYASSFSSLRQIVQRRRKAGRRPKDLLAVGDPYYGPREEAEAIASAWNGLYPTAGSSLSRLRFAEREARTIQSLFPAARTDLLLRREATEDRVKATDLRQYRILHFATHAATDDNKPARSSIILALDQDPAEDGLLQMRDILNLKLDADLVTLSSCQTGLGQLIRGEGVEGLNRAFFYAGASAVLMSLWSVEDEATFRLMEGFYRHLRDRETPAEALRDAKLELLGGAAFAHPCDWAGFVLTGSVDRPVFGAGIRGWGWAILPIVSIVVLVAILRRRRS